MTLNRPLMWVALGAILIVATGQQWRVATALLFGPIVALQWIESITPHCKPGDAGLYAGGMLQAGCPNRRSPS